VVALANGIGPVIGGALASQSRNSWLVPLSSLTRFPLTCNRRWIFRLNLFLSILTTACVYFFMPLKKVSGSWKQ
jgi:hypothetical protein